MVERGRRNAAAFASYGCLLRTVTYYFFFVLAAVRRTNYAYMHTVRMNLPLKPILQTRACLAVRSSTRILCATARCGRSCRVHTRNTQYISWCMSQF